MTVSSSSTPERKSYSQYGQDRFVVNTLLGGYHGGVFIDIGAHDGIAFSNSYLLETKFGWQGICVEASPATYERLRANRACRTCNLAISGSVGLADFMIVHGASNMLSGLVEFYDPRHVERIRREVTETGGRTETVPIETLPLNKLIEREGLARVDYLSVDVEGAEEAVLKSLFPLPVAVAFISVENNYNDQGVPQLLQANGYTRVWSIYSDDFYAHRDSLTWRLQLRRLLPKRLYDKVAYKIRSLSRFLR